jgi:hypothetical protein
MSVTSLDETIIIKNFREIRKDPSKKLEYYLNIQEILKFFLDVSVCYGEQSKVISCPEITEAIERANENWMELKNLEKGTNQKFYEIFHVDEKEPVIETIYNRFNSFSDVPKDYIQLLHDEKESIKVIFKSAEPEEIEVISNKITINLKNTDIKKEEVDEFFTWQLNHNCTNYFGVFQSIMYLINEVYPNDYEIDDKFYDKLRSKLFNSHFISDKNMQGRKFLDSQNNDFTADYITFDYKIFWLTPDLQFELNGEKIWIQSDFGKICLRIRTFFNLFIGDHDYNTFSTFDPELSQWGNPAAEELMEINEDIFTENLSSLNTALYNYREKNGPLVLNNFEIDQLSRFFFGKSKYVHELLPTEFGAQITEIWINCPELTRYFMNFLIHAHPYENIFLPNKYVRTLEDFRHYFQNMDVMYNLLKESGNRQLSWNILIIALNNSSFIAGTDSFWVKIADYADTDLPNNIKKRINTFLRFNADRVSENENTIYIKSIISPNSTSIIDDSSELAEKSTVEYIEGLELDVYTKEQIRMFFISRTLGAVLKNEDNVLLPLFKSAENELRIFLESNNIQAHHNTDFSTLLNRLKEFIWTSATKAKPLWKKDKEKFFRVVKLRNNSAHAAIPGTNIIEMFNPEKILFAEKTIQRLLVLLGILRKEH